MENRSSPRVARIDKSELSSWPCHWTNSDRGRHLRMLLRRQGVDPDGLYRIEYHPRQRYWVVSQEPAPAAQPAGAQDDQAFYEQARAELQRTARQAFASMAARSSHFACTGSDYQLPPRPEEMDPDELVDLLGGADEQHANVRFDGEGGWQAEPSDQ